MLNQILQPIQPQIGRFEERFKKTLESDVKLVQAMGDRIMETRGKILRPALSLLTAQAIGECCDRAIDAAIGIEIIHTATLIHDDVVDSAATRRGKASVTWPCQARSGPTFSTCSLVCLCHGSFSA